MLEPFLCGPISGAPLLPKLRGHFAEFLDNASPAGLRILSSSTCVGLRYGCRAGHSGFSRHAPRGLPYSLSVPVAPWRAALSCPRLARCAWAGLSFPGSRLPHASPPPSASPQYRNLRLSSIGYASPPRLRPRLPRGRSASPRNPRTFGLGDSHPHLATHSGILPSRRSTAPSGAASMPRQCSPTSAPSRAPGLRRRVSAPDIFGAGPLG